MEKEIFNKKIQIKMSEGLFMLLTFESNEASMNRSQYIRYLIEEKKLSNPNISNIQEKKFQVQVISQIAKIGNNLNQLAKVLNISNLEENLNDFDYENLIHKLSIIESKIDLLHTLNQAKNEEKKNDK